MKLWECREKSVEDFSWNKSDAGWMRINSGTLLQRSKMAMQRRAPTYIGNLADAPSPPAVWRYLRSWNDGPVSRIQSRLRFDYANGLLQWPSKWIDNRSIDAHLSADWCRARRPFGGTPLVRRLAPPTFRIFRPADAVRRCLRSECRKGPAPSNGPVSRSRTWPTIKAGGIRVHSCAVSIPKILGAQGIALSPSAPVAAFFGLQKFLQFVQVSWAEPKTQHVGPGPRIEILQRFRHPLLHRYVLRHVHYADRCCA